MNDKTLQPVLIDGEWRPARNSIGSFRAVNPATSEELADFFPISCFADVEDALKAAQCAVPGLIKTPPEVLADFLDLFAERILANHNDLVDMAHLETALPKEPRLRVTELPRTTNQLHQAAAAAKDRSWCRATIDTKLNIRSKYSPLGGPVAVFGPNNFPFAFNSSAGGDFAAAIAAGNPVIAKAHPSHPGTTRIFAGIARDCLEACGLPLAAVQLIYHLQPKDGLKLVSHPLLGATAFTGSRPAGLRLKEAADKAGKLIYLEMSSLNPIFILPGALKERAERIANELFNSCTMGAGQFCTKPGLVVLLKDEESKTFFHSVQEYFKQSLPGFLLSKNVLESIMSALETMKKAGAEIVTGGEPIDGPGICFANTLLRVSGDTFLKKAKELQQEAFGPASLAVLANDVEQMLEIGVSLEGSLTASIYTHTQGGDDPLYARLEPILRAKTGRLLNDKMPTGVAVTPAMVHGGPFPATGHQGFTSVGIPASMLRFAALHCYDNVGQDRLPPELKDKNPTGEMWRLIDGAWTQRDV
jgi:NADP-dependent aldehyde dehydrogenase